MAKPASQYGRGAQADAKIGIAGGRTDFALDIRKWCESNKAKADLIVRKVSLELFTRVILRSPVDTGRFRGNWQVTIGDVANSSLLVDDQTGQATISAATARLAGVKRGDVINLTNNLAYGRRLEYGWSQQAPAGMVGITAAEFQSVIDGAKGAK